MKKFFGLMLVAVLLVSAMSMQAFAMGFPNMGGGFNPGGNGFNPGGFTCNHQFGTTYKSTKVAATCEAGGIDIHTCNNQFCNAEVEVATDKLNHIEVVDAAVAPTCDKTGLTAGKHCGREGCGKVLVAQEVVPTLGHAYGDYAVTTAATCAEAGVETRVCANNAEHKETRAIPATGNHNFVNHICTVCGIQEGQMLTFHYLNANGEWTTSIATIRSGETVTLPNIPLVSTKDFQYWYDEDGNRVTANTKWYTGMSQDITAKYVNDTTNDNIVELSVYAHYYVDGVYHHKVRLFVENFEKSADNTMFTWLYSNDGLKKTEAALAAEGYQWASKIYYDYHDDGAVTEADLKSDAPKSVYVKVTSEKKIEATVLLHVHNKQEYAIARTITMPGYTAGDLVSYDEALAAVKKFYSGNKMSMSNLYKDSEWDDLMAGMNGKGARSVVVEDNGTTEIHVILKNATSKTSSNADKTNPKTGDYIMIAVGTMALSAAAVVTLAELKKRKMI